MSAVKSNKIVKMDIDMAQETLKSFNDDEQETFTTAFTVVSELEGAPKDELVEITQIRSQNGKPGIKVSSSFPLHVLLSPSRCQ